MHFVYILRSDKDGELYTGYTTNIRQRVTDHNRGHVPSTARRVPLHLIFFECYSNKDDAVRREMYLKTSAGKKAIKFILRTTLAERSVCS
ncbi:MAG: putative endonuclease [Candidatus Peregrinibacteria bacterium Greene0416_19]|nr:MAG: putative endonuclease [Candidatus Peregrinibacteria bacterium Greene0416_19]